MTVLSKRCVRAREHISLRLDSELSEFERALLGAHLARCEACRRFESDVRAVTERLRAEPLEPLFRRVVVARRRRRIAVDRVMQGAAAAVAVLAVGLGAMLGLATSTAPDSITARGASAGFPVDGNDTLRAIRVKAMRPPPLIRRGMLLDPSQTQ